MAFCKNCGAQIDDKAVICPKCGVAQAGTITEPDTGNIGWGRSGILLPADRTYPVSDLERHPSAYRAHRGKGRPYLGDCGRCDLCGADDFLGVQSEHPCNVDVLKRTRPSMGRTCWCSSVGRAADL